jgi:hypothetical protein
VLCRTAAPPCATSDSPGLPATPAQSGRPSIWTVARKGKAAVGPPPNCARYARERSPRWAFENARLYREASEKARYRRGAEDRVAGSSSRCCRRRASTSVSCESDRQVGAVPPRSAATFTSISSCRMAASVCTRRRIRQGSTCGAADRGAARHFRAPGVLPWWSRARLLTAREPRAFWRGESSHASRTIFFAVRAHSRWPADILATRPQLRRCC